MNLEGLSRLCSHPLPIDVAFLNKERFIFELAASQLPNTSAFLDKN
jgi:hypothetical protein